MADLGTAKRSQELVKLIMPILAYEGPDVQSATLADLLAIWVAGHAPALREEILAMHIQFVRELIPVNEEILFGEEGHPAER